MCDILVRHLKEEKEDLLMDVWKKVLVSCCTLHSLVTIENIPSLDR